MPVKDTNKVLILVKGDATFGTALDVLMNNPNRVFMTSTCVDDDRIIKLQIPDEFSLMTGAYLYVDECHGNHKEPYMPTHSDMLVKHWNVYLND